MAHAPALTAAQTAAAAAANAGVPRNQSIEFIVKPNQVRNKKYFSH
jgi:hypothetical protein